MKTISLTVNLKLDSDISDDNQIREIVENTLNALTIHCEESFITPLMSDTYITEIEVKEHFTETMVSKKF